MPMTKALKTRLEKIVFSVKDEDIGELWAEFRLRIKKRETKYTQHNFKAGDEVIWKDSIDGKTVSGTIVEIIGNVCRIRESDAQGSFWSVSGILLTKDTTLKA